MTKFYDYIKQYLQSKFTADTDIKVAVKVHDLQTVGYTPNSTEPEIQVQIIDNYENTRTSTFCEGETSTYIPMQFSAWVGKMRINGKTLKPQETALFFAYKLTNYLNELKTNSYFNKNIIGVRRTTTTPPLPFQDGDKIYTTAVRYEFVVVYPYKVELENN